VSGLPDTKSPGLKSKAKAFTAKHARGHHLFSLVILNSFQDIYSTASKQKADTKLSENESQGHKDSKRIKIKSLHR
jgi:hypothetical protein